MFDPFKPSPHFDARLADSRSFYHEMDTEERARYRAWLARVHSLEDEIEWEGGIMIHHHNNVDEDATSTWDGFEFSPSTMLAAIRAWDAGEPYAPDSNRP